MGRATRERHPSSPIRNLPKIEATERIVMQESRKETRVRAELCVEVSGNDAHCGDFRETVLATSLSQSGALLTNVHAELRCGDLMAVEYGGHHAYFRIVWVLETGDSEGMRVAIHRLSSQICPWETLLPAEPVLATPLEGS